MDSSNLPSIGPQIKMDLFPVKEVEINGIQMGVLSDGTPYLSLRGLAKLCGVDHKTLHPLTTNWIDERKKPRGKRIDEILQEQGYFLDDLYTVVSGQSNWDSHAYPDFVCMSILEYYAFDASQADNTTALKNHRTLSRQTLRSFIFKSVGIDPGNPIQGAWKCFQERILLNDRLPAGYFSVFREMVDISVPLINAGYEFSPSNVIDISVGTRWANYWRKNKLNEKYGEMTKHPHTYPSWFPQSKAGPQPANIFPEDALGEFRRWMRDEYIQNALPTYLAGKVEDKVIEHKKVIEVLEHLQQQKLPKPNK